MLDAAQRRWPDVHDRKELLLRLTAAGSDAIAAEAAGEERVRRTRASARSVAARGPARRRRGAAGRFGLAMRLLLVDKSAYVRGAVNVGEDDELCLCAVTRLELLFSARDAAGYAQLEQDLAEFRELRMDAATFDDRARCAARARRPGPAPDLAPRPADRLLRATARCRRAPRRPSLRRAGERAGVHADPRGLVADSPPPSPPPSPKPVSPDEPPPPPLSPPPW